VRAIAVMKRDRAHESKSKATLSVTGSENSIVAEGDAERLREETVAREADAAMREGRDGRGVAEGEGGTTGRGR
jgi:hypothetical protein